MTDEATVERVARAIYETASGPWEFASGYGQDIVRREARAAIAALPPQGDGWQDIASAPINEKALDVAARALSQLHIEASLEKGSGWRVAAHRGARATVTAYLAALPSPPGAKP